MTPAALSFAPAAASRPSQSPTMPGPETPARDFAGLMDGRLSSRPARGQEAESTAQKVAEDPKSKTMDGRDGSIGDTALPTHRLVRSKADGATKEVGTSKGSEASEDVEELPENSSLPSVPPDVSAELIAGCLVWPVPVQTLPDATPETVEGETLPDGAGPKSPAMPAVPSAAAAGTPRTAGPALSANDQIPAAPAPGDPQIGAKQPPSAEKPGVLLDPTQWKAVADSADRPALPAALANGGPAKDASIQSNTTTDLINAVTATLEEQTAGDPGAGADGGGSGNDFRDRQELPDRRETTAQGAVKKLSKLEERGGYQLVSPAGISTAREVNRMNVAPQKVETAELPDKPVSDVASILPHRPAAPKTMDSETYWAVNGLSPAFVAASRAQDVGPIEAVDQVRQIDRIEAVDRLKAVVSHEVQVLKSAGAGSLAVMLRPDSSTELFVQLTRNGDQIDAFVRIEKGDSAEMRQGWEKLTASLAGQQVRLLPLQSSDFNNQPQRQASQHEGHNFQESRGDFRNGAGSGRNQRGQGDAQPERSPFQAAADKAPARSMQPRRVALGRGRSLETWA